MNANEVRALSNEQILDLLEDKKEEMWVLRRDAVTGELKDMNTIRRAKHDIARLKTILRERQLAAEMVDKGDDNAQ